MQEMNTKKVVTQSLLKAGKMPVSRQYKRAPNNKNAPAVKGNAFKKRALSSVLRPCFKWDHPFMLCWPIKYKPKEVMRGS